MNWEYKMLSGDTVTKGDSYGESTFFEPVSMKELQKHGAEGWEVVGVKFVPGYGDYDIGAARNER
jgi:hypothetical protein